MSFAISVAVSGLASYAAGRAWGSEEWWRSAAPARAIGAGVALAAVSIVIVAVLPSTWHRAAFATLLLGIAAEYTAFALIDRRPGRVVLEAAWAAGTTAAAIAGLLGSPAWLAAGFIAHIGWDLMHQNGIKRIDTHAVPGWYASACIAYDLPVGIAALILN
jgi:uncharacterized protein DUF6010